MFKSRRNGRIAETEFTKADLKSGMVVQFRDGAQCLVVDQCFISNRFHVPFDNVSDNLDGRYTTAKDIMRVYEPIFFLSDLSEVSTRKILWERDESKEVTMSEVEEKFGCKVKIVKG